MYSLSHLFKTIDIHFAFSTELQQLFSNLQAARLKQDFVTNEAFDRLKQKFKIWFLWKLVWTKLTSKVLTKPKPLRRNLGTRTRPSAPECPALCRVWVQLWEHSRLKEPAVPFRPLLNECGGRDFEQPRCRRQLKRLFRKSQFALFQSFRDQIVSECKGIFVELNFKWSHPSSLACPP